MRSFWRRTTWRFAPSAAALAGFLVLAALYRLGLDGAYRQILMAWGVVAFPAPFLDFSNSLAAWDCARLGFDVIQTNPCDILGRPYNYAPVWMAFDWIPLTQTDLPAVGVALDMAFFLSLAALPTARDGRELTLRIAAAISGAVAFAVERANVDVAIFPLVLGTALAMRGGGVWRALGYGIALAAAAIKYYPAVLLGLALRERPVVFATVAIVSAALAAWFIGIYETDIVRGAAYIPAGSPYGDMFGARNLRLGLLLIMFALTGTVRVSLLVAVLGTIVTAAAVLAAAVRQWRTADWPQALAALDEAQRWPLLAAAFLVVGCFFAGQNVAYRGIFLLLAMPGLCAMARNRAFAGAGSAASGTVLLVVLMWEEAIRWWIWLIGRQLGVPVRWIAATQAVVWLMRELAWWGLIAVFGLLLAAFLAQSPALAILRRRAHA